ncbi:hypothetical protein OG306_15510 [Streptomyces sp. NBC_01241]|nr:hypothetical protein OG306_15510 [Streptomyces sp. NBC_01241]
MTTARVRSRRGKLLTAGIGAPTVVKAYQLIRFCSRITVRRPEHPT